jgi:hypothetical protein
MDYTLEELKTYCGLIMVDLRGNWAYDYICRIEDLNYMLEDIINHPDATNEDKINATEDIKIGLDEIKYGEFDGRVYRDCANYYNYYTNEGLTDRIVSILKIDMTYPEYNIPN